MIYKTLKISTLYIYSIYNIYLYLYACINHYVIDYNGKIVNGTSFKLIIE